VNGAAAGARARGGVVAAQRGPGHPPRGHRASPVPSSRSESGGPAGPGLAAWVITKLIAVLLLSAASGLLYHVATSDDFRIAEVIVAGNQLLSESDLEAAAAVSGANIFWVRQGEVRQRLQALPAVQSARVGAFLPNRLEIRVGERTPVAVWQVGDSAFLVDRDGRVLAPASAPQQLLTIRDLGQTQLRAGSVVDAAALRAAFRLSQLLPQAATAVPREFEYAAETGVSVVAGADQRVRFGTGDDLEWQVSALVAVRRELERTGQRAELIDLRFKDRPYVR
jgi:cell division protein FtsQ